jgi:hypothetical protein
MTLTRSMAILVAVIALGPFWGGGVGLAAGAAAGSLGDIHAPHAFSPFAAAAGSPFAFVSNFENHRLGNWSATSGTASVVNTPNYLGEPSLASTATNTTPQVDQATSGFVPGASSVSFQVELNYGNGGTGFVGLAGPHGFVAVIGVQNGRTVWAGASVATATSLGKIPTGTAQPAGWVDLMAVVSAVTGPTGTSWEMQAYVDRTDIVAGANLSVPSAGSYTGAEIRTNAGTVDYTNIAFSTYQIPTTIPGYNNMDGYGQGSGLLVTTLPRFTTLTAQMTLSNWTIPQDGILSFQINAMNRIGTTQNTCFGFYQLGLDLDSAGHISPWYVPNNNCVAYYFQTHSPRIGSGFTTPPGSTLTIRIIDDIAAAQIDFEILDHSVTGANRTSQVTIPYNGSAFEGAYTQIEWQPCCSSYPITSYFFNGSLAGLTISGGNLTSPMALPATYMLPFALDVPPSWNFGYYNAQAAGYAQVG